MSKSFIDLLFILLGSTIVLLSQSLQIGAVKTAPAKIGSGGISEFSTDNIVVLAVHEDYLEISSFENAAPLKVTTIQEISNHVTSTMSIVVVAGDASISHQRIMTWWDHCRKAGFDVKLGAMPENKTLEGSI